MESNIEECPHEIYHEALARKLWCLSAGSSITLPCMGEQIYYFPQGHLEQLEATLSLKPEQQKHLSEIPSKILCEVMNVNCRVDPETERVFAEITLLPLKDQTDSCPMPQVLQPEYIVGFFCKTLTKSDISSHGSLIISQQDAKKCLPPLDLTQEEPHQELIATDLHGKAWHFRHVFCGSPKRHLLTFGWKDFRKSKRLGKDDMVIFLRGKRGEILIGVRKALKQKAENIGVLYGVSSAIKTQSLFCFTYTPRSNDPKFMVNGNKYHEAQNRKLSVGSRVSMRFEGGEVPENNGTIVGFQDNASSLWTNSEWKYVTVHWNQPSRTCPPEKVSPWELELSPNLPLRQRSKRAKPDNIASSSQNIRCQKSKGERQIDGSFPCTNERESNYGVRGVNDSNSDRLNRDRRRDAAEEEVEIEVSKGNLGNIQHLNGLDDGTFDAFCNSLGQPSHSASTVRPSIEYGMLPSIEHGIMLPIPRPAEDCENFLPSTEVSPPIEFGSSSSTPPMIIPASMNQEDWPTPHNTTGHVSSIEIENPPAESGNYLSSQGNTIETSFARKADFHGFQVWEHVIPHLELIHNKTGEFWQKSRVRKTDALSSLLNGLGEALCLKDKNWKSLNPAELNNLIDGINDALNSGFLVDFLRPVALKAEAVLNSSSKSCKCDELESKCNSLYAQYQSVFHELENLHQEVKSLTEGLDFQLKCFNGVFD